MSTLGPAGTGQEWKVATLPPPAFAPDDAFVVSCNYAHVWWSDDHDDWCGKSPGGDFKAGSIAVHDLVADAVTNHDVMVRLQAGWAPDSPEDERQMIWGPEFVSDRAFRIWLPDGSVELLELPLPRTVLVTRTLGPKQGHTE
jgi:hypothetical protein